MSNNHSICIVIPSYNSKKTINQCLNSVLNQSFRDVQKVIVVDSSDDGTDDVIKQLFPTVKLIHIPNKTLPGAARNIGVRDASSEYIAFTDTDCIVDYYWIENMIRRMVSTNSDAVGGAVINGTPESISGTIGYLNEFSFYLPGIKTGFVNGLATANVCYKRSVFDKQQFMETHFAGELFFDRTIKVKHKNRKGFLNVLKHQRKMGEGAGIARIVMKRDLVLLSHPILLILILPWIRLTKMHRRLFLKDKRLWKKTILFFPLSVLIAYFWSFGFLHSILSEKDLCLTFKKGFA